MKPCPLCAEEIQDAAVRCKHCHGDLRPPGGARPGSRPARLRGAAALGAALGLAVAAALAVPAVAGPILARVRQGRCQPVRWSEWHAAMQRRCLAATYVCEHMTTGELLQDPESAAYTGGGGPGPVAEMVGHVRRAYGCLPEAGVGLAPGRHRLGGDVPASPPSFSSAQDAPRSL